MTIVLKKRVTVNITCMLYAMYGIFSETCSLQLGILTRATELVAREANGFHLLDLWKRSVPISSVKDYDFWDGRFRLTKCYLTRAVNSH